MGNDIVRIMLKIGETTIEVEGPESYVDKKLQEPESFDNLITKIGGVAKPILPQKKRKATVAKERKPKRPSKQGYEIVKDLVLAREGDKQSLKEFYSQKNPSSNYERNAVFCYYLLKIREFKPIGVNHIYTCYREVNQRVGDLVVSLSETSRKGWLDTSNMNDIMLSVRGENFVEYDLPKVKKAK
jgi:hypothetical protein